MLLLPLVLLPLLLGRLLLLGGLLALPRKLLLLQLQQQQLLQQRSEWLLVLLSAAGCVSPGGAPLLRVAAAVFVWGLRGAPLFADSRAAAAAKAAAAAAICCLCSPNPSVFFPEGPWPYTAAQGPPFTCIAMGAPQLSVCFLGGPSAP